GGNTNYGYLLGSPVGRDGRAIQCWSNYWLSPRTRIEGSYRQLKGSPQFLAGGSTQTDGSVKAFLELDHDLDAAITVQLERFFVPVLGGPRRNAGAWFTLIWRPNRRLL